VRHQRFATVAGSSSSGPEARKILTPPRPVVCDAENLELAGLPRELVNLLCVDAPDPADVGCGPGAVPVAPDPFERELVNLRIAEDPDLRPYVWEDDECP